MRNDHVVTVYQVGDVGDVCYLAMELLVGEPLDRWLARVGTPPLGEAVRITREIAVALAAAHDRGLIHRDVKPENVWLEAPARWVKLLDFGLVPPQDEDVHLTRPGMVVGTPMFLAPSRLGATHSTDGPTCSAWGACSTRWPASPRSMGRRTWG